MKGTVLIIGPAHCSTELQQVAELLRQLDLESTVKLVPSAGDLPQPLPHPSASEKSWTRMGILRDLSATQFLNLLNAGYSLFHCWYDKTRDHDHTISGAAHFFRIRIMAGYALIGVKYTQRGNFREDPPYGIVHVSKFAFGILPVARLEEIVRNIGSSSMMPSLQAIAENAENGFRPAADENELTARLAWDGTPPN